MRNTQQPTPQMLLDGNTIECAGLWDTIQGEGRYSGVPSVFIRLKGCNLQCPNCDTLYNQGLTKNTSKLVRKVLDLQRQHVVITGGEPFRQNITELVNQLKDCNLIVTIETNGTLVYPQMQDVETAAYICCSPKSPKLRIPPNCIDWFKYVLHHQHIDPHDGLPTQVLGYGHAPARPPLDFPRHQIFLQPEETMDDLTDRANLQACVDSSLKYGYRLSVQLHKLCDLP